MLDRKNLEDRSRTTACTLLRIAGRRRTLLTAAAALAALALSACGGGGGGTASAGSTGGALATVRGVLTSTQGGLTLDGVTFSTAGAVLHSSDESGPVALGSDDAGEHLRPGMVVSVRGRRDGADNGQATEVEFHDQLEGEVESHDAGELTIQGVRVSIDDDTAGLDRRGGAMKPEDAPAGTRVAVSGQADSHGGLRATLVRERDSEGEQEVRAFVTAVSGTVLGLSFDPSGPVAVRVDVSGISPLPSFAPGTLVEVRIQGPADADGVFTATAIRAEDDLQVEDQEGVEVEGIVTATAADGFTVAGQQVVTTSSTSVEGGTLADVAVGVELEVEGAIDANGVLLAKVVKLRASVRIRGNLASVDAGGGTLTVSGVVVHVTPSTELHGFGALSDLTAGVAIDVRGTPSSDGGVNALRVDLKDS